MSHRFIVQIFSSINMHFLFF